MTRKKQVVMKKKEKVGGKKMKRDKEKEVEKEEHNLIRLVRLCFSNAVKGSRPHGELPASPL